MHLLKCDVHICCKNPHENLLIAYMKRLKRLRNDIHTKYNFLSDRNIRDWTSRVHIHNASMEKGLDKIIQNRNIPMKVVTLTLCQKWSLDQTLKDISKSREADDINSKLFQLIQKLKALLIKVLRHLNRENR